MKENWDDCDLITQSEMIAYSQIRDLEDQEIAGYMMAASGQRIF